MDTATRMPVLAIEDDAPAVPKSPCPTDLYARSLAVPAAVWASCLRRIQRWRLPPHWTAAGWHEEIRSEAAAASLQAARDFDSTRGVPWGAFVRSRIMAGALTRYRKEWTHAIRQVSG